MENKFKESSAAFFDKIKKVLKPNRLSSKNSYVSLDVGSTYVKAISLEKSNQDVFITGFSCEKIEADAKEAIKKALSSLPAKKKELILSISGPNIILRYVNIPLMNKEETDKAMSFELERYIPFNREDVNYDFVILKTNKNTGKMLVLIAAAKKDIVDNRINLCRELGYQLDFIDVCPLAIANYFEFASDVKDKVYAVVNLGATVSSVDIIEDGLLVLSRDIFIGGNDFTKKISEVTNKSIKEAEEIKLKSLTDSLLQSLEPIFNNLVKELKISFDFYETQENRMVDKVLITGGSAYMTGMLDIMKHYLGQDIELITFDADRFKVSPSLDAAKLKDNFNFFTFALGMAVRNFK
jgi:type IV pilus assembly protein PilM